MKYTIEGFSQEQLLRYKLDVTDALILRWFMDFVGTGKMKKVAEGGKVYYCVKYDAILGEFPIFDIGTSKSIANRFGKYCALHILSKKMVRVQSGTQIYFCINEDVISSFIYSKSSSTSGVEVSQEKPTSGAEISQEKPTSGADVSQEKSTSGVEVSQEKPTSGAEVSQEKPTSGAEVSQEKPTSGAEVSQEKSASGALNRSFHKNTNPATTTLESESTKAVAESIKKYFDVGFFDTEFIPRLSSFLRKKHAESGSMFGSDEYIAFAYSFSTNKNPRSLVNHFYKTCMSEYVFAAFLETEKVKAKRTVEQEVSCPVCASMFDMHVRYCPTCNFDFFDHENQWEIERHTRYVSLSEEEKGAYETEMLGALKNFTNKDLLREIDEKYGLTAKTG